MKYHILVYIFVFLFLNACNTDFNNNQKDIKPPPPDKKESRPSSESEPSQKEDLNNPSSEIESKPEQESEPSQKEDLNNPSSEMESKPKQESDPKQEEELNKKIKNLLLNDLRKSIELANEHKEKYINKMKEEPSDQYGMPFNKFDWPGEGSETTSANTNRSIKFRRHTYTVLSTIDTTELKELSHILLTNRLNIFRSFSTLGHVLDTVTDHLYPKKDTLDKLDTSDLEKLKNNLEKILSTINFVSETLRKLILDYKNNENLIKTDKTKLQSYSNTIYNQIREKTAEAQKLQDEIKSIDKF
ncbi:virulence associated lipoprotein [Borreliella lusitaniae]|uniref:virulence associated lipoprotein n=1 Tax=Borreliella lusitaniae TaxID=100177 RepID=UPI003C71DC22